MAGGKKVTRQLEREFDRRVELSQQVAEDFRERMQAEARQEVPWINRTGYTTEHLFAVTQFTREGVALFLTGQAPWQRFLELAHNQRYAHIRPITEKYARPFFDAISEVWE